MNDTKQHIGKLFLTHLVQTGSVQLQQETGKCYTLSFIQLYNKRKMYFKGSILQFLKFHSTGPFVWMFVC